MKKIEKILALLLAIALILNYCRIPGGKLLFTVGSLMMITYYLLSGVWLFNDIELKNAFKKSSYSAIGISQVLMSIWAGISLSVYIAGIMFLVGEWPGTKVMLYSAVVFLGPCTCVCIILNINKRQATYKRILLRIAIAFWLLSVLLLLQFFRNKYWI